MSEPLRCWRCGSTLDLSLPLNRLDECAECRAELHVCRMCVNFARQLPTQCAEQDAEEVRVKDRANFCDWFRPAADAYSGEFSGPEQRARQQLDALFGGDSKPAASPAADDAASAAEALFGKKPD